MSLSIYPTYLWYVEILTDGKAVDARFGVTRVYPWIRTTHFCRRSAFTVAHFLLWVSKKVRMFKRSTYYECQVTLSALRKPHSFVKVAISSKLDRE